MRVLVAVASKHGSTWEIARAIGDTLAVWGLRVDVIDVENAGDLSRYDAIVLGSAVYAGHWLKSARTFVEKHAAQLSKVPLWLFSSGPLGLPPKPVENSVNITYIARLVRVKEHRVFAGRLKKRRLSVAERIVASLVHASTGDFRNWEEIHAWAAGIARTLKQGRTVHRDKQTTGKTSDPGRREVHYVRRKPLAQKNRCQLTYWLLPGI